MIYKEIDKSDLKAGDYVFVGDAYIECVSGVGVDSALFMRFPALKGECRSYGDQILLAERCTSIGCKCFRGVPTEVTCCAVLSFPNSSYAPKLPAEWAGKNVKVTLID